MTSPQMITPIPGIPYRMGDEDINVSRLAAIRHFAEETGDRILHHTTFDFGSKVLALTSQGIVLSGNIDPEGQGGSDLWARPYSELSRVEDTGHDREIRLIFHDANNVTWRMGDATTVAKLKDIIRRYRRQFLNNGNPRLWSAGEETETKYASSSQVELQETGDQDPPPIAERVRFWEEQDRINQALIPRVIRQNELLTKHIAEHDDLPQLIGRVMSDALAEQATQYENALEKASTDMKASYDEALVKAKEQHDQEYEKAVDRVREQANRFRKRLIFVTSSAVAAAVVAVIIAILV